jgi:SAM-dependent methyltransferase
MPVEPSHNADPWSTPETVAGFAQSAANQRLLRFAEERHRLRPAGVALDIGCGAARNTVPLARLGWQVVGMDLSWPMLISAARRAQDDGLAARVRLIRAAMDALPARDQTFDLIVAHGIWNLARSSTEFRRAVAEAARVAAAGADLFVFTFSRHTLPDHADPVAGEPFVFTTFSGQPQCFLTEDQLVNELQAAGFSLNAEMPIQELNRRAPRVVIAGTGPVIYEGAFRFVGSSPVI